MAKDFNVENIDDQLREGTPEDIAKIVDEDIRDCIGDLKVHDGDLHIKGHFDYSDASTLVSGNLIVDGTLSGDETGVLAVTGKLTCKNLFMEGSLCAEEADIKEVAFGFYEAGITSIRNLRGKLLLLGNHCFESEDDGFEHVFQFSNYGGLEKGDAGELKGLLSDEGHTAVANIVGLSEDDDDEKCWSAGFMDEGILR